MSASDFHRFYETWLEQLRHLTTQLSQTAENPARTRDLIHRVMAHYTELTRVKSLAAESDVLSLISAPWATSLERSLHWAAGFRPTIVFHLIYTASSSRFGPYLPEMLRGGRTGDLGELSPGQLNRVSELQCETVKKENLVSRRLSEWHDEIVGVDWEAICGGGGGGGTARALEGRIGRLREVVATADLLRMESLRKVVEVLTPKQAAEFLVAAAELLFGVRVWGLQQERFNGVV